VSLKLFETLDRFREVITSHLVMVTATHLLLLLLLLLRALTATVVMSFCLQCFDAVGWVAGRASGL